MNGARRPAGFSLVELMIAMSLGLLIIAAVGGVFVTSSRNYREDRASSGTRDEMRFGQAALVADIEMAGYWTTLLDPTSIATDASLNDPGCGAAATPGWAYTDRTAVSGLDNVTSATATAAYPCIAAGEIVPNTDIIVIKRVAGVPRPATASTGATFRTNGTIGSLFLGANPSGAAAVAAPSTDWEYRPYIYYVRPYSTTVGDGIPTLCRKTLSSGNSPTFQPECLAEGIEDLQAEYGVDVNGDCSADIFLPQPTAAQFGQVVSVRLYLLGRSSTNIPGYTNAKSYTLSNAPARTPNDNRFRRVSSTTVYIRNPNSLRRLLGNCS